MCGSKKSAPAAPPPPAPPPVKAEPPKVPGETPTANKMGGGYADTRRKRGGARPVRLLGDANTTSGNLLGG